MLEHRIAALDAMRGVAVVAVVALHLGLLRGGWVGVDAFFVLSGFLITSLLLAEEARDGRVALLAFWGRRVRRLLPALLVVVAAIAVVWSVAGRVTAALRGDVLSTLAYVANWRFIVTDESYFASFDESPLRHAWSLAIEEQFYLVWPLVFLAFVALRARPGARITLVAVAIVASTVWMHRVAADPSELSRAYYGSDTRAATILTGCLAALVIDTVGRRPAARAALRRAGPYLLSLGLVPLAVVAVAVPADTVWLYRWGGFSAIAVLAAAAVVGAAHLPTDGHPTAARPLVRLGVISYSLYLWHWPVILLVTDAGWARPVEVVVASSVSLALAELTYRLVERPARHVDLRPAVQRSAGALAGVTALAVVVTGAPTVKGVQPEESSGTFAAIPAAPDALMAPIAPRSTARSTATDTASTAAPPTTVSLTAPPRTPAPPTTPPPTTAPPPTTPPPTAPPPTTPLVLPVRVTVVGDSVSWSLGVNPAPDAPLVVAGGAWHARCDIVGARVFTGEEVNTEEDECPEWPDEWSAALAEPTDAVVVVLGLRQLFDLDVDGQRLAVGTPDWEAHYRAAVRQAVDVVRARTPAPVLWFDVPCYEWAAGGTAGEERDPARVATVNAVLRDEASFLPGVTVVPFSERVCAGGQVDFGLRPDGAHLTESAAHDTWRWLVPAITRAVTGGR